MDYICTLFKNDPQFWSALISIVLCFCFRAYRLERDNIHFERSRTADVVSYSGNDYSVAVLEL